MKAFSYGIIISAIFIGNCYKPLPTFPPNTTQSPLFNTSTTVLITTQTSVTTLTTVSTLTTQTLISSTSQSTRTSTQTTVSTLTSTMTSTLTTQSTMTTVISSTTTSMGSTTNTVTTSTVTITTIPCTPTTLYFGTGSGITYTTGNGTTVFAESSANGPNSPSWHLHWQHSSNTVDSVRLEFPATPMVTGTLRLVKKMTAGPNELIRIALWDGTNLTNETSLAGVPMINYTTNAVPLASISAGTFDFSSVRGIEFYMDNPGNQVTDHWLDDIEITCP